MKNIETLMREMEAKINSLYDENKKLKEALKEITEMAEKWSVKGLTPTIFKAKKILNQIS